MCTVFVIMAYVANVASGITIAYLAGSYIFIK